MKWSSAVLGCIVLIAHTLPVHGESPVRAIHIKNFDGVKTVPKGKIWEIRELKPYASESGVGTADLYVDGEAFVGDAYTLDGKFEISVDSKQTSPIVFMPGTTIEVGDSRGSVVVYESDEPDAYKDPYAQ